MALELSPIHLAVEQFIWASQKVFKDTLFD